MADNQDHNVVDSQKPKTFPLSLALVFIMGLCIINLRDTQPIIPIFGFHGITNHKNSNLPSQQEDMDYPQQDLEKLLNYLIVHDYWFLSTQDLYDFYLTKSKEIPATHRYKKPIMLTFDDGYKTISTNLLPLLSKLEKKYKQKVKVVLFINPGTLASDKSVASTHLGCRELREGLQKEFFDIQSHGLNHKNLTEISRPQLVNELLRARIELRKCTQDLDPDQRVASHLAYPYGAYNKQVESYVFKYYLSSYLYNNEILDSSCLTNYYKIPRLMVNRHNSNKELIKMAENFKLNQKTSKPKIKC
ncbi:polysaccharide deacetylase family protein [Cylindrospermum sp. FACHB-282]|uniref:polysaccharide deacetylase family protein n=1 Tax=Cylindrospermum sp. FACHB-282 TaxID=2692794 RepID=UPI0016876B37|nr:polysaccharide deacetylase family protein [Cylindrospermum sp. FACHB-282]MBD2386064.1 polysaccharide deacetylase family protein [Cylindrospermum sp. FACHB-282]